MFLDVILLAIFRFFRREFRIRQASKWVKTTAAPEDWTCIEPDSEHREGWRSLQVRAVLRYQVSGESFSGLLRSYSVNKEAAWRYVDEAPKPVNVVLRYDPRDPARYRVLPEDNKDTLRFEPAIY